MQLGEPLNRALDSADDSTAMIRIIRQNATVDGGA
jgi:hypothetical protein